MEEIPLQLCETYQNETSLQNSTYINREKNGANNISNGTTYK